MWNSEGRLACTLRLGAVTVNAEVACACSRPSIALVTIAECWVMANPRFDAPVGERRGSGAEGLCSQRLRGSDAGPVEGQVAGGRR